nr:sialidase family protein [Nonomuraea sp. MG754425]
MTAVPVSADATDTITDTITHTTADTTADPFRAKTTVVFSDPDVPSGCHRIPAIVRAVDGSLLAFAEHRLRSCADKSDIETVVRRLPAGAKQWLPEQTVVRGEPDDPQAAATRGNAAPVVYRRLPGAAAAAGVPDGRIVLLGTHNPVDPANPGQSQGGAARTPYVLHSDDHGVTWSQPRMLAELDDPGWGHYATGPVHAIQLTRGAHAGRLVAGVNYVPPGVRGAMLVYSDDGGTTWQRGARAEYPLSRQLIPQEMSLAEQVNGDIFVWARQNWSGGTDEEEADPDVRPHRAVAVSKDGGQSYDGDFTLLRGFEAPPVQSAALRLRATDEGDRYNRILTSAASVNTDPRSRMTIRSTFDEGLSWQGVDTPARSSDEGVQVWGDNDRGISVEDCACYGGYSDMVELPDGDVGLLYERTRSGCWSTRTCAGTTDHRAEIAFVVLDDRDLRAGRTRRQPDPRHRHHHHRNGRGEHLQRLRRRRLAPPRTAPPRRHPHPLRGRHPGRHHVRRRRDDQQRRPRTPLPGAATRRDEPLPRRHGRVPRLRPRAQHHRADPAAHEQHQRHSRPHRAPADERRHPARRVILMRNRSRAVLLAIGVSVVAALTPVQAAAATADPFAARTTVLFSSPNVPTGCYRIPAVVRAVDGSLLAFAEHRFHTCADKSNIETVVRRLPAGATVWEPPRTVVRGEAGDPVAPATRGNPGPVVYRRLPGAAAADAPDGRIVLLGTHNPVDPTKPGTNHRTAPRTPYVVHSDDHGVTWSQPRMLAELDDPSWGHYATGPVHAIQLTRGPHAGRLIAGVNYNVGDQAGAMLVHSDDGGLTWQRGADARYGGDARLIPQELSLVELVNGDVMVWARQNWTGGTPEEEADLDVRPHRAVAISKDGGASYHSGFTLLRGFEAPHIQSSSLRLSATDEGDAYNRILTFAPSVNVEPRIRPTIRSSFDEGVSWQSVDTPLDSTDEGVQVYGTDDRSATVEECACYGGYGDLVELPGGQVGLIYERGATDYRSEIVFVVFDERDLHTPSTTPDVPGRSALVFDGVTTTRGVHGQALAFDGVRGRVQVPSVQAEPGGNRIRGTVTTTTGTAEVSTSSAYADGTWHHLALRRHAGNLTLFVDGRQISATSGSAGTISTDGPLYLGQQLDGTNRFHGSMDEFRVYDRALSTAEVVVLRATNTNHVRGRTAHLPMNAVVPAGRAEAG